MMGLDNPIHIAFLLFVVLLVFGAKRLPEIGRSLGAGMRGFKDTLTGESVQPPAGSQPELPQAVSATVAAPALAPVPTPVVAPLRASLAASVSALLLSAVLATADATRTVSIGSHITIKGMGLTFSGNVTSGRA